MRTFILLALVAFSGAMSAGLSECQRRRENSLRNQSNPKANQTNIETVGMVVECNDDGTYKPLQCFPPAVGGGRFCLCYDSEGQIIKQASKRTKTCACHLEKYNVEKKRGQTGLACEVDGSFKKTQCSGGSWWCVDPATGAMKGSKRSGPCSTATCA
ncbi:U24-ctenitoxin-Pn1a-like isoform X2 [Varroa jacobsoni]|uniref:Thyroglobulin type-1 domain-containing protein n=1 Tax=Varroa destructor TaxID=109461 RepID=A0A7M7JCB0_VARDE|nr:thyroglobulin-like isoform X2 [Varroa destructor]XP_022708028.1 U24-ctenitoxin-Pn1a-like isoform X2 [Varroa jacobsoni]